MKALRVSPRVGLAGRFISLPNGLQIACVDCPELDALPQCEANASTVTWLERRSWVAAIAVMLTIVGLAWGHVVGLPLLAGALAERVSFENEARLGGQMLATLDHSGAALKTRLTGEQIDGVKAVFARVAAHQKSSSVVRLEVRAVPSLGANAFVLPGAILVVTDDLVNLVQNPEQLACVLAHEFGHLEHRHALRHALQGAGLRAIVGAMFGDASSAPALGSLPTLLAQLKYSREMESEADDFALRWLKSEHIAGEHFARILELLAAQSEDGEGVSYLSTHPDMMSRLEHIRATLPGETAP